MKQCCRCKEWKSLEEYNKDRKAKDGKDCYCRECRKIIKKEWVERNKNHVKEYQKKYNSEHEIEIKEKYKEYSKQYREENKEILKLRKKEYYQKNKDNHLAKTKKHYEENKEKYKEYNKQYYKANKEKCLDNHRKWCEKNEQKYKEYHKKLYESLKKENNKRIAELVETINPIFSELELPIYGVIYKFENIKTGRVYIGQTTKPLNKRYNKNIIQGWIEERLARTKQKFKEELNEEDIVYTDVLDVGCCAYHLDKLEAYYINKYNSCKNGYNNDTGHHRSKDGKEEFEKMLRHMIYKAMESEGIDVSAFKERN